MKWVTRQRPKTDRVACPWLIERFIDSDAEFLFVPPDEVLGVAEREEAIPFVLIFVPLALALGYDSIVGVSLHASSEIPFSGMCFPARSDTFDVMRILQSLSLIRSRSASALKPPNTTE